MNFSMARVNEREWPTGRAGKRPLQIEPEAVEYGSNDVSRLDRPIGWHGADRIARKLAAAGLKFF